MLVTEEDVIGVMLYCDRRHTPIRNFRFELPLRPRA